MADKGLMELFHDMLRDIYYAENAVLKALPRMQEAAVATELKQAFGKHLQQTEGQVDRLDQVFAQMDMKPSGKKCDGIEGILKEGEQVMKDFRGTSALDAGLISSAQAVEHYEMTRYGTLCRWAELLGMTQAAALLHQTLQEESQTDELLTRLADAGANRKAA